MMHPPTAVFRSNVRIADKPTGIHITKRKAGRIGIGAIDLEGSR